MQVDRLKPLQPGGSNQRLIVASGVVAGLLIVVAMRWWDERSAAHSLPDAPMNTESQARPLSTAPASFAADGASEQSASTAAGVESAADPAFRKYVTGKYRFLSHISTTLQSALLAREQLAVVINTARQSSDQAARAALPARLAELAELDRKIGALLRPADLAMYAVLKDSDIEQFQLEDYAGGISNVAPLREADKQAILYTKLVYRQRFRQVLDDSALMRGELTAPERRVVFTDVSRALTNSRDSFLEDVRQYLPDEEQYALLRNYENTEYEAELAKLRSIADGE